VIVSTCKNLSELHRHSVSEGVCLTLPTQCGLDLLLASHSYGSCTPASCNPACSTASQSKQLLQLSVAAFQPRTAVKDCPNVLADLPKRVTSCPCIRQVAMLWAKQREASLGSQDQLDQPVSHNCDQRGWGFFGGRGLFPSF